MLLAEDHPSNVALMREILETDFDVIATVEDGRALIYAVLTLRPDVIVTDISFAVFCWNTKTREILQRNPAARVVFVTVHSDPALVRRGLAAGGLGYVLKLSAGEELVPAVWAALRGERWCLCNS